MTQTNHASSGATITITVLGQADEIGAPEFDGNHGPSALFYQEARDSLESGEDPRVTAALQKLAAAISLRERKARGIE